jgi:anhydro-N-acetylmuramic acid kinase
MQFLDYIFFRDRAPIATLNIGGISNIQVADADRGRMRAFDCGPGNVMIDHAMRRFYAKSYDDGGATAARGTVDPDMLTKLLGHPFFARPVPRCAWRLDFGADYANSVLDDFSALAPEDLVATLTRFSAEAIVRALRDNVPQLAEITTLVTSGGGARNETMLAQIAELLPAHMTLRRSDDYGLPAQFKEAIKFATLAVATLNSIGDNIPAASGAVRFGVLGKLVQAPRNARLTA